MNDETVTIPKTLYDSLVDEVRRVTQELDAVEAEETAASREVSRLLSRAIEALELVMQEPVGGGIQVKQRIGAELAYGIEHTIRELRAHTAGDESHAEPASSTVTNISWQLVLTTGCGLKTRWKTTRR